MTPVLFTCAGLRVDIVSAFRKVGALTVAADIDPLAPALYFADRVALVPRSDDPAYVSMLANVVRDYDVRLVVPLSDVDTVLLAREGDALAPALVLGPTPDVATSMSDKWLAHQLFEERGIPSPRSWLPSDVPSDAHYPLLVKARRGYGSRDIHRVARPAELAHHIAATAVDSFVQEQCRGEEFSIDVLCDLEGQCLNAIPRTMLHSKGGESIKGRSLKDWALIEHGKLVAETIGIRGPANIQCFRELDGELPVTDVNTRFGGGFPLPLAAGSHFPELALALARGERPEPRLGDFRDGVTMTRFYSDICLVDGPNGTFVPLQ